MWKAINSPMGIGVVGGAGANALWALISNISVLRPYIPAITSPVQVPVWVVVGVCAFVLIMTLRMLNATIRKVKPPELLAKPSFAPNEVEMAVVVLLRAEDRSMLENEIASWVVEHAPDHIGREDVRIALAALISADWLSRVNMSYGSTGYRLTPMSLSFANSQAVKPIRRRSNYD